MSQALTTRIPIRDRSGTVIDEKEVVTYAGLLARAHEDELRRIETTLLQAPAKENQFTAIVLAVVETSRGTFTGLGDASPDNVNRRIAPHLLRMAETRAKARALRDAVNIGTVCVEELGEWAAEDSSRPSNVQPLRQRRPSGKAMTDAQRRLLYQLIVRAGNEPEASREVLLALAGVSEVSDITVRIASRVIDQLKREVGSAT